MVGAGNGRGKYCEPSVWLYLSVPRKSVRWRKFFNFSVQAKVGQIEKLRFSEFSLGPKFWAREIPSFEDLQVLDPYQLDLRVRVVFVGTCFAHRNEARTANESDIVRNIFYTGIVIYIQCYIDTETCSTSTFCKI